VAGNSEKAVILKKPMVLVI
jgi:hypothetical protein